MPKCSLVGVYNSANVDGAVKSADLCVVAKSRRKSTSGSIGVQLKEGSAMREVEGVTISKVSEFILTSSTSDSKVVTLSCNRGS